MKKKQEIKYRTIDTAVDKPEKGDQFRAEGFDEWNDLWFGGSAPEWLNGYHYRRPLGIFPGTVKSGLARIRRELKKLDVPLGKIEGAYHPYGPEQRITPGVQAHRVGCSRTISVEYTSARYETDAARAERKALIRKVWAALRAAGLPLDDKGWMDCEFYNF